MKIYFDESGNTGADLLNKDQKLFVLASNSFTEDEVEELIKLFEKSEELHFVKLRKSFKGRESIIKLLNHKLIDNNKVLLYVANKEFVTVAQIVDILIEPFFFDCHIDIYRNNYNIIISNYIYYFGNFYWNKRKYESFIKSFIDLIRQKNKDSINNFYSITRELYSSLEEDDSKKLIFPILYTKKDINNILDTIDKFSIDITFSCFVFLCSEWYRKHKTNLDIYFDESKQMRHYHKYLNFLRNMDIPTKEIGYGSRKIILPLQLSNFNFSDSRSQINIQISDILASSISFMFNNKDERQKKFIDDIKKSRLLNLNVATIMAPSDNITIKNLEKEIGEGENPINFLVDYVVKNQSF